MWVYILLVCMSAPTGADCFGGVSPVEYRSERACEAAAARQHDHAEAVAAQGAVPLLLVQTRCVQLEREAMS